jgi:hypothetical protein
MAKNRRPSAYKDFLRQSGERDERGVKLPERGSRIDDFGPRLRGLGGLQTARIRPLRGATLGPASQGRKLSRDELARVVEQMKKDGKI